MIASTGEAILGSVSLGVGLLLFMSGLLVAGVQEDSEPFFCLFFVAVFLSAPFILTGALALHSAQSAAG